MHQQGRAAASRHRDLPLLQELEVRHPDDPFKFGRYVAEWIGMGVEFIPEVFRDLVLAYFPRDSEREAWAGFHRFRCQEDATCICRGEDYEEAELA